MVILKLPLLQAKQPRFPQLFLITLVLQTLHWLCCPSSDTLQHLNVFLTVRDPKLNIVFKLRPHQSRVWGDNHYPSPISDKSQDAIGVLSHLSTLLFYIQVAIDQNGPTPRFFFFFCIAFQPLFLYPVCNPIAWGCHAPSAADHLEYHHMTYRTTRQIWHLTLLNLIQLALSHQSSPSRSFCRASLTWCILTFGPYLMFSPNLLRVHFTPFFRPLASPCPDIYEN